MSRATLRVIAHEVSDMRREGEPSRDARSRAPVLALNLRRPTEEIYRDLCAKWPNVVGLWWELDDNNHTGWARCSTEILAKLVHLSGGGERGRKVRHD